MSTTPQQPQQAVESNPTATAPATSDRWDEPDGTTARGTVIVLTGRGETATTYQRLGRRLAADGYRVRIVTPDPEDIASTRTHTEKLLADETLPQPHVLLGSDSGATVLTTWAGSLPHDGLILAGLAWGSTASVETWEAELEARTACPVHRRVLTEDQGFQRGAYQEPVAWTEPSPLPPQTPTLVLHGSADTVTPLFEVLDVIPAGSIIHLRVVNGGRHDVLNDAMHRSVAATIVLFLESLRLGADLPDIVNDPASASPAPVAGARR